MMNSHTGILIMTNLWILDNIIILQIDIKLIEPIQFLELEPIFKKMPN